MDKMSASGVPRGISGYLIVIGDPEKIEEREVNMKNWCGLHKPKEEVCPVHTRRWAELHDDALKEKYKLEAVFYCPLIECDNFSLPAKFPKKNFHDLIGNELFEINIKYSILLRKLSKFITDK